MMTMMMMSSVSAAVVVETFYSQTQSFFFKLWFDLGENYDLANSLFLELTVQSCILKVCLQHVESVCAVACYIMYML